MSEQTSDTSTISIQYIYDQLKGLARRYQFEDTVVIEEHTTTTLKAKFFTNEYSYHISANNTGEKNYLGCILSCRKPAAGEDWTRGSDLPDGELTTHIWNRILLAIIGCELVQLQRPKAPRSVNEDREDSGPVLDMDDPGKNAGNPSIITLKDPATIEVDDSDGDDVHARSSFENQ